MTAHSTLEPGRVSIRLNHTYIGYLSDSLIRQRYLSELRSLDKKQLSKQRRVDIWAISLL